MMANKKGTAMIILLLIMSVAMSMVGAAVVTIMSATQKTSFSEQGVVGLKIAESGAEEALIRILRDPNYTGGTLTIDEGNATIQVTGSTIKTITVTTDYAQVNQRVVVTVNTAGDLLKILAWQINP